MNEEKLLDIRAQLEEELTWRRDEIRLLHNQLGYISEVDQRRFRKALIVMLYSHFEGFCSTAFQIYIKAINEEALKRKQLNYNLAANSFADVFTAYENPHLKTKEYRKIFKKDPPEEKAIEKFSRQVYFIENLDQFWEKPAIISDEIINTGSNLRPNVLKKLLYRLGLPYDYFNSEAGKIEELVNRRNAVAHGAEKDGIDERTYSRVENSVFKILNSTILLIMDSLKNKEYMLNGSR